MQAACDVVMLTMIEGVKRQIQALKPLTVFVGIGRGASEFYSPKLWERFIWKYLRKMVDVIIEAGSIPNLHIDANWERDLKYFGICLRESVS